MSTVPELHTGIDALDAERAEALAGQAAARQTAADANARAQAAEIELAAVRGQLVVAKREIDRVTAAHDELELDVVQLAAEVQRLKAKYEGGTDPDPDPEPTTRTMTVGAVIGPQCHTVPAFITAIGTPGVRRYFSQSDFAPITSHSAVNQDLGKWDRLISYKPPGLVVNRTRLLSCLDSIPDDGRRTVIMCQNEPERNDKGLSAAAWRPYVNDFIEQVVDWADLNGRTDVLPGWSFSYWRPLTDPTIAEWWPTCPNRARAVFGCQSYDPLARKTLEEQTKTPVDRWRAAAGDHDAPWMLSEVNTKRTGTDGAKWWQDGLAWAAEYGCSFVAVYDDVVGKDGPWCVVDRPVQQALGKLMPAITVNI